MKTVIILGSLFVSLAIGAFQVAESCYQTRQLMGEIQSIKYQRDDMRLQWSQLILEESTLTDEAIIYQVAEKNLGMILPTSQEVVYNVR